MYDALYDTAPSTIQFLENPNVLMTACENKCIEKQVLQMATRAVQERHWVWAYAWRFMVGNRIAV